MEPTRPQANSKRKLLHDIYSQSPGGKAIICTRPGPYSQRVRLLGASGVLLALVLFGALLLLAQGNEVKIQGHADWPFVPLSDGGTENGPQHRVIRSQEELLRATGLPGDGKTRLQLESFLKDAFQTKKVNFKRRMLVVVRGGVQRSAGCRVEVTKIEADGQPKVMRVHWKLHAASSDQPEGRRLHYPATVVLIRRFDGEVKFEPSPEAEPRPGKKS